MIKKIIFSILFLIYIILGASYTFFSDSTLNKVLSTKFGFAQLYAFSTLIGFIAIVISVLIISISIFRNQFKFKINAVNSISIFTIIISIFFVFFSMDNKKIANECLDCKTIKLVEWNTADNLNEKNIQDIFGNFDADIAVFPEFGGYEKNDTSGKRLADLFGKTNIDFEKYEVYTSEPQYSSIAPVTIVIKKEFGNYTIPAYKRNSTSLGTLYLSPTSNDNPPIIGLHTSPPLTLLMFLWRMDINSITEIANENENSIIIGDFNATMKHGSLNDIKSHVDVLEYASKFNSGTWNTNIPSIFRTRIDHILIPKDKYSVKSVEIKNYNNSDHVGVFTEIQERKKIR